MESGDRLVGSEEIEVKERKVKRWNDEDGRSRRERDGRGRVVGSEEIEMEETEEKRGGMWRMEEIGERGGEKLTDGF